MAAPHTVIGGGVIMPPPRVLHTDQARPDPHEPARLQRNVLGARVVDNDALRTAHSNTTQGQHSTTARASVADVHDHRGDDVVHSVERERSWPSAFPERRSVEQSNETQTTHTTAARHESLDPDTGRIFDVAHDDHGHKNDGGGHKDSHGHKEDSGMDLKKAAGVVLGVIIAIVVLSMLYTMAWNYVDHGNIHSANPAYPYAGTYGGGAPPAYGRGPAYGGGAAGGYAASGGARGGIPSPMDAYERQRAAGRVTRTRIGCATELGFERLPNGNCGRWVDD